MNKVKCGFCGCEYNTPNLSFPCRCGQRARLVLRKCRVCGVERFISSRGTICRACSREAKRVAKDWLCRCGHKFSAAGDWQVKCPSCGKGTSRRLKICSVCGAEFYGSGKITQCPDCANIQRKESRAAHLSTDKAMYSEDQLRAVELCEKAALAVHKFIWAEIYRRPRVAERIAKEAKTAPQAQEIINEENNKYYRQRSSFGVASYG